LIQQIMTLSHSPQVGGRVVLVYLHQMTRNNPCFTSCTITLTQSVIHNQIILWSTINIYVLICIQYFKAVCWVTRRWTT